jgi:hypothetical protein
MISAMNDRAYLAIIQWPDGWSEEFCGNLLAHAAVMDPYNALMAVKKGVPGVVALLDPAAADQAVDLLRSRGVMAVATRRSTMHEVPEPISVKRLWWEEQAGTRMLGYERWRGQPQQGLIDPANQFLLVRARLTSTERRTQRDRGNKGGRATVGFMVAGVGGALIGAATGSGSSQVSNTSTRLAETMDLYIHTSAGALCLRISAGRFDASILGEQRGRSPAENMPLLATMLLEANRRTILDQDFEQFRAPNDVVRGHFIGTSSSSVTRTSDLGEFDFYSAWSYLLYRSMMP